MANTTEAIFAIRRPRAHRRHHKSNTYFITPKINRGEQVTKNLFATGSIRVRNSDIAKVIFLFDKQNIYKALAKHSYRTFRQWFTLSRRKDATKI